MWKRGLTKGSLNRFCSYLDNKNKKDNLINKKEMLTKKLNVVEHKNNLLSDELNFDYLDILIREKLKFGHSDEIIIKINE